MDTPQEPTVAMVGLTERERESAVAVASLAGVGVVPEGAAPDLVIAGEGAAQAPGSSAPRVSVGPSGQLRLPKDEAVLMRVLASLALRRAPGGLRLLVALMTVATLAIGVLQVLIKPILMPMVSTAAMGAIETIAATGMLVGASLVTIMKNARPTTLLAAGLAGTGAAMVLVPLGPGAWWVSACGFLTFASLPLSQAGAEVLVRGEVDLTHDTLVGSGF